MEDDVPGRVAGAVADVEHELADGRLVPVRQPARRLERPARDAVLGPVVRQALDPVNVGLVRAFDRHAKLLGKHARAAAMVDMAVRQQDLLDRHACLLRRRLETGQVAARIDEGAVHGRGAPDQ